MTKKYLDNVRINPSTGKREFYFPMEVKDPADKEYARLNGLEIGKAMLGFRTFEAIMIPCKNKTYDSKGREIYLDTPSEEQHRIYKALTEDELDRQRKMVAADRYETIRGQFLGFVKDRNPKLLPLAELLTIELTKSEASRKLGLATSTVSSQTDKLKELLTEFLGNANIF